MERDANDALDDNYVRMCTRNVFWNFKPMEIHIIKLIQRDAVY